MIPTTKSKGKKMRKIYPIKQGQKLPPILGNLQGFLLNTLKCHKYYCSTWLKMPCDSTPWTGTQVANHSWSLALAKSWTGSPETWRSHEPGAEGRSTQWAEQYIYQYRETDNQQVISPRPRPSPHPGKATPGPVWQWPAIWNRLYSDDSCGFKWCDVDTVTPEFPLDLQNTSPEYFCHRSLPPESSKEIWGSAANSSSRVWGGAPAANTFFCIFLELICETNWCHASSFFQPS